MLILLILALAATVALVFVLAFFTLKLRREQGELRSLIESQDQTRSEQWDGLPRQVSSEFKKVADESMKTQGEQVAQRVQSDVGLIMDPFKSEMSDFRKRIEELYASSGREQGKLEERLRRMDETTVKLNEEAKQLAQALSADSKSRGSWGEVSLRRALEESGLKEGEQGSYELQKIFNEDGVVLRPDAVLHLPKDRHIIIDAKVSLVDYLSYCSADDEQAKSQSLKGMESAMQKQVDEISDKYVRISSLNSPGIALMYTPIESAWQLAMEKFPKLFDQARKSGVIICGSTTLLATLRLVEQIWLADQQLQNVREIIDRADKLQIAVWGMVGEVENIRKQFEKASDGFDNLINTKIKGRQGIMFQSNKLLELGAKGSGSKKGKGKLVEESLLEARGEEDAEVAAVEAVEAEFDKDNR